MRPRFLSWSLMAFLGLVHVSAAQAAIDLQPVGQWGGSTYDVRMVGDLAYAAIGPRLVILNVSDPTQPVRVGQSDPLPAVAPELEVLGSYAYLADGYGGLQILDVSTAAQPLRVGAYVDEICQEIATTLPYAYLLLYDSSGYYLLTVDVSDPSAPELLSVYEIDFPVAFDVAVRDTYVYVSVYLGEHYFGILCIDVSDPGDPVLKGKYVHPYQYDGLPSIAIKAGYLYAAGSQRGLHVLDISTPSEMTYVGMASADDAELLAIPDNRALLGEIYELEIFDLTEPTKPAWLGAFSGFKCLRGVWASGNHACAADWSVAVKVLDVADPAAIQWVGTYDQVLQAHAVAYHAGYAYLGGFTDTHIVDAGDPAAPQRVAVAGTGYGDGFAFAGNYAYVAASPNGLIILDVTDPAKPVQVGAIKTQALAVDVALAGKYAWVADHIAGVTVVDVGDPGAPTWLDTYDVGNAYSVVVRDEYAYVADAEGWSLYVMELVDGKLNVVGKCPTIGSARDVVLDGPYAYVAAWTKGVDVIDISDPANPYHVATCDKPWPAQGLARAGDYLFVADGVKTHVVDVSDPLEPERLFSYFAGGSARDLAVAAGYLYIADGEGGLAIVAIHIDGDLNCDGRVNAFDVDPFVQALVDPAGYVADHPDCHLSNADLNADGKVDAFDIDPFVELLTGA